ncbi:hypothetical protein MMC20_003284 [Loxospora ochrophaea]|nr:hypothetical protein [Loxospora ochrophaea]
MALPNPASPHSSHPSSLDPSNISWRPCDVLNLHAGSYFTCSGWKKDGGRCGNPIAKHNRGAASDLLEDLVSLPPYSPHTERLLSRLASRLLCVRNHQDQRTRILDKWRSMMEASIPASQNLSTRATTSASDAPPFRQELTIQVTTQAQPGRRTNETSPVLGTRTIIPAQDIPQPTNLEQIVETATSNHSSRVARQIRPVQIPQSPVNAAPTDHVRNGQAMAQALMSIQTAIDQALMVARDWDTEQGTATARGLREVQRLVEEETVATVLTLGIIRSSATSHTPTPVEQERQAEPNNNENAGIETVLSEEPDTVYDTGRSSVAGTDNESNGSSWHTAENAPEVETPEEEEEEEEEDNDNADAYAGRDADPEPATLDTFVEDEQRNGQRGVNRQSLDGGCRICWQPFESEHSTVWCEAQCGQNFHQECIDQWAVTNPSPYGPSSRNREEATCPCW